MRRALLGLVALAASANVHAAPHHAVARQRTSETKPTQPPPPPMLAGDQYLFGSAEASALTREVWRSLVDYAAEALKAQGNARRSVVLARGATLDKPSFVPCGDKPPAAVFDVDETVLLNLGAEYDTLVNDRYIFDDDVWNRWEQTGYDKVAPSPGAKEALDKLRAMGVTVIFSTNRSARNAQYAERALNDAGLGPAVHGRNLFLSGDDPTGSLKDTRRWAIADRYCVLAMAGDQLGDLSDRFNSDYQRMSERRELAALPAVQALWGNGWFVFPNPVYGSAIQGGADDIFPTDKQWRDPGPQTKAAAERGSR